MTIRAATLSTFCATLALLTGCKVGPNYRGPPDAAPRARSSATYHRAFIAPVTNAPPLSTWWVVLGDDTLNSIEQDALNNSPSLELVVGKIRGALATLRQQRATLLPTGGVTAAYARVDTPPAIDALVTSGREGNAGAGVTPSESINLYSVGLTATWQVDLFGGVRRQIASASDVAQAYVADLQDAQVTLTMNVAMAYVNLRDAQHRLALAKQTSAIQEHMLALTRLRRADGTATDGDVERVVTPLKQTQADLVPLEGQVEIYIDQLSQLAGHEPGTLDHLLDASAPLPRLPAETSIGNPGDLLRRRPDIRAAERRLAAANESIGADIAQYFPSVTIYGTLGYGSTQFHGLVDGANLIKLVAPVLSWNLLSFPVISAQVEGARASFDQARATYRSTVLSALLDAENGLSRFGHQRDNVTHLTDASASAARAAEIADIRFKGGTLSLIDALDVERQRVQTESSLAQARATLTTDWISLQSSLGLGWREYTWRP